MVVTVLEYLPITVDEWQWSPAQLSYKSTGTVGWMMDGQHFQEEAAMMGLDFQPRSRQPFSSAMV